ncbi:MAG: lysozyme inhibitor LprI family protein [Hyphomicrobiales bacterium]|nr:lysozyme inhibitor LprI family protein [Hyphomicrobiales bacterium]
MTRFPDIRRASLALGVLLAFGAAWAMPARAESVPASFDCARAERPVEKLICSQAVLRWNDLALSRAYAAAKAEAVGAARDDLLLVQRDWVRERDRRCVADRTFAELSDTSTELGKQAYDCLKTVYVDRRRELRDLAVAPLAPLGVEEIDLKPITAARPEIVEKTGPRISRTEASPDGSMLAILLPSLEFDFPDQIWLYRVADRKLVAATPPPSLTPPPHPDGSPAAIKALAWQGSMLYARVAIWSAEGESEEGTSVVYAASMDGSRRLDDVPGDIYTLLDEASQPGIVGQNEVPESDWDILDSMRGNRDFLVWAYDLGHATIELRLRERTPGSPTTLVAWGGWELASYLFDAGNSLLAYPADTGLVAFDMETHKIRRIAGTSRGDRPHALSADLSLLVWSTRNSCGDEFLAEQDESAPERFCLAHLQEPETGK